MVSPLFNAADYASRKGYPPFLFSPLSSLIQTKTLEVLDLGAGTGQSSEAFSIFYPNARFTLVEPNAEMLEVARDKLKNQNAHFLNTSAENISLEDERFDLVLIGSAWHWMDAKRTLQEIERLLVPGGGVFVFEYQFPKIIDAGLAKHKELNEWIRRQFNLYWKAPEQKPRGTLQDLTDVFRTHSQFSQKAHFEIREEKKQHVLDLAQEIFSQSRFLHYESASQNKNLRKEVLASISEFLSPTDPVSLSYFFEAFCFLKRVI